MIEVLLPDIGDFHDVEVIEILVKPGDRVEAEYPLITLESDKASMEIPSPQAGVIAEVRVALGDKINRGDLLMMLETAVEGAAATPAAESGSEPAEPEAREALTAPDPELAPAAATATESEIREVALPDIGDFKDVEIVELLVSPGDVVEAEQSLLTLETDKATMEIPAPFAGTVKSVGVAVGDKINQGDVVARIETTVESETVESSEAPAATGVAPVEEPPPAASAR
jgi:pyruvate dehydrogenase E2 component (dihydrolipoamide acetyltransferase)